MVLQYQADALHKQPKLCWWSMKYKWEAKMIWTLQLVIGTIGLLASFSCFQVAVLIQLSKEAFTLQCSQTKHAKSAAEVR